MLAGGKQEHSLAILQLQALLENIEEKSKIQCEKGTKKYDSKRDQFGSELGKR